MKRTFLSLACLSALCLGRAWGDGDATAHGLLLDAGVDPVLAGFRLDDNVFRAVTMGTQVSDFIDSLDGGGFLNAQTGIFDGRLNYQLSADQYWTNSILDNLENHLGARLDLTPGPLDLYYEKDLYVRDSHFGDFDYVDEGDFLGLVLAPRGPWDYGLRYKYFSRVYYSAEPSYQSRNFADQEIQANVQRAVDDRLSLKLSGSYNDRQFNRYAVLDGGASDSASLLQQDQTWTALLGAHFFLESVLQDLTYEHQRTNSNSYGFSNTVDSLSWAAVLKPVPSFYLQLFWRFYSKVYDVSPVNSPDLQLGFVDEDSQDILSLKASWEWGPQWDASLGLSRLRVESDQPDQFYVKDILAVQVRRGF